MVQVTKIKKDINAEELECLRLWHPSRMSIKTYWDIDLIVIDKVDDMYKVCRIEDYDENIVRLNSCGVPLFYIPQNFCEEIKECKLTRWGI